MSSLPARADLRRAVVNSGARRARVGEIVRAPPTTNT